MGKPTMPPPGGHTIPPDQFWAWFTGLPTWVRAVAWFFLWPALAAVKLYGMTGWTRELRYGGAAATLIIGGFVWAAVLAAPLSGGDDADGSVTAEPPAEAAEQPDPEPDPAPEPEPEPEPDDAADVAELKAIAAEVCSDAVAAGSTPAGQTTLRGGAADAARYTGFSAREIRQAATDACGDQVGALVAPPELEPAPGVNTATTAVGWTVTGIVDGDTIEVEAEDGTVERVRVVGIDTPERGECGFDEASDALAAMIAGQQVELVAGAQDDRDHYDRILRYVDIDGTDAGLGLINDGLAIARYDSRDGYGKHPREDAYVAADTVTDPFTCAAPEPKPSASATTKPVPPPAPTAEPMPVSGPGTGPGGVWKNCTEARDAGAAPVRRGDTGYGKHLDRDDDGIGCE